MEVPRPYPVWGLCLSMILLLLVPHAATTSFRAGSPWGWRCVNETCVKEEQDPLRTLPDLDTCKLTCAPESVLWPRPTGLLRIGKKTVFFLLGGVELVKINAKSQEVERLLREAFALFNNTLASLSPRADGSYLTKGMFTEEVRRHRVLVELMLVGFGEEATLTPHTREEYTLSITTQRDITRVVILATDFFGARHGLETLSQLIVSDEDTGLLKVIETAAVTDAPAFPYRGLMLDTSRNFVSVEVLQRTLDAMAASKLNTLHWHITDSHSFPLVLNTLPNMAYYGAYSPREVYSPAQVRDLVQYARVRGIRLLPELDAPAHVGNGWQWGEKNGIGRLAVCVNQEPWQEYCDEPPCGQLNPALKTTYTVLENLYTELLQLFSPNYYFHYGGSQISLNCWNTTEEVTQYLKETGRGRETDDLLDLWGEFQLKARALVEAASPYVASGIVRSSALTSEERRKRYLDPTYYTVQITTRGAVEEAHRLTQEGYNVILSDPDTWDLTCGLGHPYRKVPEPCGAYKGWQVMYGVQLKKSSPGQVLGGEAVLWSQQVDDANLDVKVWPRAAALAERLWSNPVTTWEEAETRFIHHRQRLVKRGVSAERVQPEWCHQNEGLCYL